MCLFFSFFLVVDEIIERDLPFLSSVVFLRFRPVVVREREEEERR